MRLPKIRHTATDARGRRVTLFLPVLWSTEWKEIKSDLPDKSKRHAMDALLVGRWLDHAGRLLILVMLTCAIGAVIFWNMAIFVGGSLLLLIPILFINARFGNVYQGDASSIVRLFVAQMLRIYRCPACGYRLEPPGDYQDGGENRCSECGCIWTIPQEDTLPIPDLLMRPGQKFTDTQWWRMWRAREYSQSPHQPVSPLANPDVAAEENEHEDDVGQHGDDNHRRGIHHHQ